MLFRSIVGQRCGLILGAALIDNTPSVEGEGSLFKVWVDPVVSEKEWTRRLLQTCYQDLREMRPGWKPDLVRGPTALCFPKHHSSQELRLTLVSDPESWLNPWVADLAMHWLLQGHSVSWFHDASDIEQSDVTFLLSYSRIATPEQVSRSRMTLVVHESDLPMGRG